MGDLGWHHFGCKPLGCKFATFIPFLPWFASTKPSSISAISSALCARLSWMHPSVARNHLSLKSKPKSGEVMVPSFELDFKLPLDEIHSWNEWLDVMIYQYLPRGCNQCRFHTLAPPLWPSLLLRLGAAASCATQTAQQPPPTPGNVK